MVAWKGAGCALIAGFGVSELKEVKGVWATEDAIEEPNDSDRFISGGERSEETVRRWLGGDLYVGFAIVRDGWGRGVCGGFNGRCGGFKVLVQAAIGDV